MINPSQRVHDDEWVALGAAVIPIAQLDPEFTPPRFPMADNRWKRRRRPEVMACCIIKAAELVRVLCPGFHLLKLVTTERIKGEDWETWECPACKFSEMRKMEDFLKPRGPVINMDALSAIAARARQLGTGSDYRVRALLNDATSE